MAMDIAEKEVRGEKDELPPKIEDNGGGSEDREYLAVETSTQRGKCSVTECDMAHKDPC